MKKTDVRCAFWQIEVDPAGAVAFGYVVADDIAADMRLQFRWRRSPKWWGVVASAMQDAQRETTRVTAVIIEAGNRTTSHVKIVLMTRKKVESLPVGCEVPILEGGGAEDGAGVSFSWMTPSRWKCSGKKEGSGVWACRSRWHRHIFRQWAKGE